MRRDRWCAAHDAAMQAKLLPKGKTKMQVLLEVLDVEVYDVSPENASPLTDRGVFGPCCLHCEGCVSAWLMGG